MATTTCVNGQTVVHKTSDGILNTSPDVCLTPVGIAIVPIPYSNTATSKDTAMGSNSVSVDGNPIMLKDSVFSKSAGDEPGVACGVRSGTTGGAAQFVNYSFDVKVEGRNVCRRLDLMTSNNGNTPPAALMQPNVQAEGIEGEHFLSITFDFKHADVSTGIKHQPTFSVPHTAMGNEYFRYDKNNYCGAHYYCQQKGEYELILDKFDLTKAIFEKLGD
jgi:hypothetical protein